MEEYSRLSSVFQTLADPNRLRIIRFLGKGSYSVSEIVSAVGLSQPLVSHHLKILREKQVLVTERQGPFVYHRLKDPRILDALGIFSEIAGKINENRNDGDTPFDCPPWFQG